MKSLILVIALFASPLALAQRAESVSEVKALNAEYESRELRHLGWFRVSAFAGPALRDLGAGGGSQNFESGGEKAHRGGSASLLLGVGRGLFTLESGVMILSTAAEVHSGAEARPHLLDASYVGIPVFLKLNYIEHPQSTFSLKLGALPGAQIINGAADDGVVVTSANGLNETRVFLPKSDTLMMGGVSGTAPISARAAFLLDLCYYQGTTELDEKGAKNRGVMLNVGLVYSL